MSVQSYLSRMQARTAETGRVDLFPATGASSGLAHVVESIERVVDRRADVLLWASNNRSPMDDMLAAWLFLGLITEAQATATSAAKSAQDAAFIAEYIASQPPRPSDEERYEARAAFGPGEVVVDVVSGRRFTT